MDRRKLSDVDLSEIDRRITHEQRLRYSAMPKEHVYSLDYLERIRYFCAIRVRHHNQAMAQDYMLKAYMDMTDARIMAIIGPPGVGKSAFADEIIRSNFARAQLGELPYLYVDALADGSRASQFSDLMPEILRAGGEIAIADKFTTATTDGKIRVNAKNRKVAREHVRKLCRERKVRVLVLDELIHVLRNVKEESHEIHDGLKSLALDLSGMLCLIGDVELYNVLRYGQLVRRGDFVYLGRYTQDEEDEARAEIHARGKTGRVFPPVESYVRKLKAAWPCREVPPFENAIPQIIKSTAGLPGTMKRLLTRCLVEQLWNGGEWKPRFFNDSTLPAAAVETLLEEVKKGEVMMRDKKWNVSVFSEQEQDELEDALALAPAQSAQQPTSGVAGGKELGRDEQR